MFKLFKWRAVFLFPLVSYCSLSLAESTSAISAIKAVNCNGDQCKLVFELNNKAQYKIFTLKKPDRFVIDFSAAQLIPKLAKGRLSQTAIKDIRYAKKKGDIFRIVFIMRSKFNIAQYRYSKNPTGNYSLQILLKNPNSLATLTSGTKQRHIK